MPSSENGAGIRKPRASRRRPDLPPPKVERLRPRSGMSRSEVVADQRRRVLAGLAAALAYHGYEDTKITDIVELSGVSRPTFYELFEGKEQCFAAAYADGVERLSAAVETAARAERGRVPRLSAGLRAGLEFLAADPPLAHLLLVESLAASRPARLEHERSLGRLAQALCPADAGLPGAPAEETGRLLAGALASHLSGRVLAGEAKRLAESQEVLLQYLLVALPAVTSPGLSEQRAAHG
ncbi:MAG TPA: TetR/AcrR family transcriptional regulator [Solirubrobacterales bacterium]|nr:TetR/AcrR family transcriptional regulator [Solirubrobacterales bacterium]